MKPTHLVYSDTSTYTITFIPSIHPYIHHPSIYPYIYTYVRTYTHTYTRTHSYTHSDIHTYSCSGSQGAYLQSSVAEGQGTPWTGCQSNKNNSPQSNLIYPSHLSLLLSICINSYFYMTGLL